MAVTNYTLADLISDVYRLRYQRNASEASQDERNNVVRSAERHARMAYWANVWYFGQTIATDQTVTDSVVTIPSDCSEILRVTNSSTDVPIGYTQRSTTTITLLDSGVEAVDIEYKTNEPTYVPGTETTAIPSALYEFLKCACLADMWIGDQQGGQQDSWMKQANIALRLKMSEIENQKGIKRRPTVRTYNRLR